MTKISEREFARLCDGINEDRAAICRHNPIGTANEILLWMLLGVLASYLNLSEIETPCFTGAPTAETYRDAIRFVLQNRRETAFDADEYLNRMTKI
jgi:hypothetical protein